MRHESGAPIYALCVVIGLQALALVLMYVFFSAGSHTRQAEIDVLKTQESTVERLAVERYADQQAEIEALRHNADVQAQQLRDAGIPPSALLTPVPTTRPLTLPPSATTTTTKPKAKGATTSVPTTVPTTTATTVTTTATTARATPSTSTTHCQVPVLSQCLA